jgi:hypothetical protein
MNIQKYKQNVTFSPHRITLNKLNTFNISVESENLEALRDFDTIQITDENKDDQIESSNLNTQERKFEFKKTSSFFLKKNIQSFKKKFFTNLNNSKDNSNGNLYFNDYIIGDNSKTNGKTSFLETTNMVSLRAKHLFKSEDREVLKFLKIKHTINIVSPLLDINMTEENENKRNYLIEKNKIKFLLNNFRLKKKSNRNVVKNI